MGKKLVVHGAQLECSQGSSPSQYAVNSDMADSDGKNIGTVMDFVPILNIKAFGMCKTQTNPQVASATAAALGVLTPQPCIPIVTAPWSPGSSISSIDGKKVLTEDSTCKCQWTGSISVKQAGTEHDTD
jgi:hypothetical protein